MKKILLLGGSMQQIPAITYANQAGYHTVLCDYLSDNPGQYQAKTFHNVSTTDQEAVLEVAKAEKVDGVLAYASDPAALTAAYVGECLHLPTNTYQTVRTLSYKDEFRAFLKANNFACPKINVYSSCDMIKDLDYPVMVKPVDSSGSKGVRKVENEAQLKTAIDEALSNSRAKRVVIEQYINKDHPYLVGGDCFILDNKVVYWGLLNCYRDDKANMLVPSGKSHPLLLSEKRIALIKETIQRVITLLGFRFGAINVEVMVDSDDNVYIIEIGPRNGGNMIPELLKVIDGADLTKASVETAMGNHDINFDVKKADGYYTSYNIHSDKDGRLMDIYYDDMIKDKIIKQVIYKNKGDQVGYFDRANQALGIVFLKFDDQEEQLAFMDDPTKWIKVTLDKR